MAAIDSGEAFSGLPGRPVASSVQAFHGRFLEWMEHGVGNVDCQCRSIESAEPFRFGSGGQQMEAQSGQSSTEGAEP